MSVIKDEEQHKKNLKELGKFGALSLGFFFVVYLAMYINIEYTPRVPWFLAVIIIGAFMIVPKARRMMRIFDENTKQP